MALPIIAQVQIIHNSPNSAVDVYVNGLYTYSLVTPKGVMTRRFIAAK